MISEGNYGKNQREDYSMPKITEQSVREIIEQTVERTRIACERTSKDAFKATEKRLYAYSIIKLKILDLKDRVTEIQAHGVQTKSKSIIKYSKTGIRLSSEEIADALIMDIAAEIAGNEAEIETVDKALATIADDPYAEVIRLKYFEGKNKDDISALLHCDKTTVWRNASRLVSRLSVFLYGVSALG
jgi:DNA-directed RNA polymerase specialized sigma24 family protein